jgi:hypothetical protein
MCVEFNVAAEAGDATSPFVLTMRPPELRRMTGSSSGPCFTKGLSSCMTAISRSLRRATATGASFELRQCGHGGFADGSVLVCDQLVAQQRVPGFRVEPIKGLSGLPADEAGLVGQRQGGERFDVLA